MFSNALKAFMRLMPQSLMNIRGMAGADVDGLGNDPDLLCQLGTSFFRQAADKKEIEWPNLRNSLQIFSHAAGDREQYLQQCLPDFGRIELWVVSDSALSFTNYKKQKERLVTDIWEEREIVWLSYISDVKFAVCDCGQLGDLIK